MLGIYTVTELAQLLSLQRYRVDTWVKKEGLKAEEQKFGGRKMIYVHAEDFWEWIKERPYEIDIQKLPPDTIAKEPKWVEEWRARKKVVH